MPEIRGEQIKIDSITGDQIKDESITGLDIKDGSIKLADLNVEVTSQLSGGGSWKSPVANASALPSSGNSVGDVRLTLDNFKINIWNGSSWVDPLQNVLTLNP